MNWIALGAWSAFLGVALGAFGAHALRQTISESAKAIYQTAVLYHFVHSFALIAVGWLATNKTTGNLTHPAGLAFTIGIVLFSGSLYLLSVSGARWLGMITPLGGLAFMAGWACLALAAGKAS